MSKLTDVTEDLIAGYSLPHCDGFRTLFLRSESSVACILQDLTEGYKAQQVNEFGQIYSLVHDNQHLQEGDIIWHN